MELPTGTITVEDFKDLLSELRALARHLLKTEQRAQSLTPTALALTALRRAKLKDAEWETVRWENRNHFFAAIVLAMRHALIDRARNAAARRQAETISLDDNSVAALVQIVEQRPERFIALDEALAELEARDEYLWNLIRQFYYAGYTIGDMATFSGCSEKTVDRDLKRARLTLKRLMERP